MLKSSQLLLTLSFLLLNVIFDITSVAAEPPTFAGYPISITYQEFEKIFASEIKECTKSNKFSSYIEVGSYLPKTSWKKFGNRIKTNKVRCSMKNKIYVYFATNLKNELVVWEILKELKDTALLVVKRSIEKKLDRKTTLQKKIDNAGFTIYKIEEKFHNGLIIGWGSTPFSLEPERVSAHGIKFINVKLARELTTARNERRENKLSKFNSGEIDF